MGIFKAESALKKGRKCHQIRASILTYSAPANAVFWARNRYRFRPYRARRKYVATG